MKRLLQTSHRPVVWISIYYIAGIIGGSIWNVYSYTTFFLYLLIGIIPIAMMSVRSGKKTWILLMLSFITAYVLYFIHPVVRESRLIKDNIIMRGEVVEQKDFPYQKALVVDSITMAEQGQIKRLSSKVQVITHCQKDYKVGTKVKLSGKVKEISGPMNPSDMNVPLYLKSKGISATIQAKTIEVVGNKVSILPTLGEHIQNQIQKVFNNKDLGMISKLLINRDEESLVAIEQLYYGLGIGHVLAISGLHIGILFGIAWWVLGKIKIHYRYRIVGSLLFIWGYTFLIGLNISAVRACIILTVMYIGRILWQEEDIPISMGIAALIVLIINPYQLFQVGFQLSFVAYGTIFLIGEGMSFCKVRGYTKRYYFLVGGGNILLSIAISPILAWHFYEVPVLGVLLNYIVIPLFGVLIPISLITLAVSYVTLQGAMILGMGISMLLKGITHIAAFVEQLPFATIVVGKPSFLQIALFLSVIVVAISCFMAWRYSYYLLYTTLFLLGIQVYGMFQERGYLDITHLYVGQGDSTVIITPTKQLILIDGGSEGEEKTIERYIKYRGYADIDYTIVSHPHEDHIGGVLGLIEGGITMKNVMMPSRGVDDEWEDRLKEACAVQDISYRTLQGNETIQLKDTKLQIRVSQRAREDVNDGSAVCLLSYGYYSQLFTGDMSKNIEEEMAESLPPVTVLKVAHHGSETSTGEKFLEHVRPKYGMISCGIMNRYHHPHTSVIERLERRGIMPLRTDKRGSIRIVTNGERFSMASQIQED